MVTAPPNPKNILSDQVIYLKRGRLNKFGFEPAWNSYFDFYLSSKYLEKPLLQLEDVTFHLWLRKNLNDEDPTWQMPSIRIMKRRFGIGQNKIEAMLDRLEKAHLLRKVSGQGSGDNGANVTNTYELSDPIPSLDDFLVVATAGEFPYSLKDEWQHPPVPKIGTGAVPEISTPPVPKMGRHKHTSSFKQTTLAINQKSNNNSSGEHSKAVVVALTEKGIGKQVAERLASRYKETRIFQKVEYLEFLLETNPQKIANPRGWLRSAIEQDYGPPDGFQSKAEREQAAAAQKRALENQQRLEEQRRQQELTTEATEQQERQKRLENARTSYGTSPWEDTIWQNQVLDHLRATGDSVTFKTFMADSHLLKLDQSQAVIWLPNTFARDQVDRTYGLAIKRLLAKVQGVNFQAIELVFVIGDSESHSSD